jgi:hypothetical protein
MVIFSVGKNLRNGSHTASLDAGIIQSAEKHNP